MKAKEESIRDKIAWDNEIKANKAGAISMLIYAGVLFIALLISLSNKFGYSIEFILLSDIPIVCVFLILGIVILALKCNQKWMKYAIIGTFILVMAFLDFCYGVYVGLGMLVPIILTARYGYKKFTIITIIVTGICFLLSGFFGILTTLSMDLNIAEFPAGYVINWDHVFDIESMQQVQMPATLLNFFYGNIIPKYSLYFFISFICYLTTKSHHEDLARQKREIEDRSKTTLELDLARKLQKDMLPSTESMFQDKNEFNVFAIMDPARQVGGDFYDCFLVDDRHLAVVIGDVSGKGVPASLFMVVARTTIKDNALLNQSPSQIFTNVNAALCENNKAGLFVTGWIGILDFLTGKLVYCNAGHNPPVLIRNGQNAELVTNRNGVILAARHTSTYSECEIHLEKGDRLFIYTDGVTEAKDIKNQMYGEQRLLKFLNKNNHLTVSEELTLLRNDIDSFANGEEQFDDITMLILQYNGGIDYYYKVKTFIATRDALEPSINFIKEELQKLNVSNKITFETNLIFEELLVNIVSYAYGEVPGPIHVIFISKDNQFTIKLIDSGKPFDPLKKEDPDIKAPISGRAIGGLGIFLSKKLSDAITYKRENNKNVIAFTKNIQ